MSDHDQYFDYLMHRSRLGKLYRHHWLYPRISRHLEGAALDIGCGIGDMLAFRPETVGVDVNPKTVGYCCSKGLDAHLMEPDILPFADKAFDSALMDNVLEHIVNPSPILNEVHRVLAPGGSFVVGVPGILGWHSDSDHKVFYGEETLRGCVEKHGFKHILTFHTPLLRSSWLESKLRQYCVYGVFQRAG